MLGVLTTLSERREKEASRMQIEAGQLDAALALLIPMFPTHSIEDLTEALINAGGDAEDTIEYLLNSDNGKKHGESRGPWGELSVDVWKVYANDLSQEFTSASSSTTMVAQRHSPASSTLPWRTASSYSAMTRRQKDDEEESPKLLRQKALEFAEKRAEAYHKAAASFRSGKGESASFYAEQAKEFDRMVKHWNSVAAKAILKRQNKNMDTRYCVDLHGLSVAEAVHVALEAANTWYTRVGHISQIMKPLELITGQGRHSTNGRSRLYPAVLGALRRKQWRVEETVGALRVTGVVGQ